MGGGGGEGVEGGWKGGGEGLKTPRFSLCTLKGLSSHGSISPCVLMSSCMAEG